MPCECKDECIDYCGNCCTDTDKYQSGCFKSNDEATQKPEVFTSNSTPLLCFYVLYEHGGIVSWRVTNTLHNLDKADGLIAWIAEREDEKPEHNDFFLKFWKRLEA